MPCAASLTVGGGARRALAAGVVPVGAVGRLRRRVGGARELPCGAYSARQWPRGQADPAGGNDEDDQHESRRCRGSAHVGRRTVIGALLVCAIVRTRIYTAHGAACVRA